MRRFVCFAAVCFTSLQVTAGALKLHHHHHVPRRRFMEGLIAGSSSWFLSQKNARAAKGAAEYDLEYYMRDLFGGNVREGTVLPSKPPPVPPPRTLQGPLLPLLLNDDCTPSCIPTRVLLEQLKKTPDDNIVTSRVQDYRSKAFKSFQARAPWKAEHVSDQYYFDLTSYALWRSAADLLPNYVERDVFARNIGRGIYQAALDQNLVSTVVTRDSKLTDTLPAVKEILNLFQSSNYCKSYRLGEKNQPVVLFDEFDNDDLSMGATVNGLISVFEPATLGASLQITGEQSRFSPEFVGTTLAAMWERAGITVKYETYFVDQEYRPNPKDYFPNEQLLQFSLTSSK